MSVASISLAPYSGTDTDFRAWGSVISAQLLAVGLVKGTDSGQIDWTTIAHAGAGSFAGYEIWHFADALQSTAPVFIKIEFGGSIYGGSSPALAFTVGSATDGAGTLTGSTSARKTIDAQTNNTLSSLCYFSGSTNRFAMYLWASGANVNNAYCFFVSFERTVDAAGAVTGEGVLMVWKNGGGSGWRQMGWNCTTGPMSTEESSLGCMGPSVGSGSSGTETAVYPIYLTKGVFLFPGYNLLGCFEANFTPSTTVTFTYYGASHTFMVIPSGQAPSPMYRATTTTTVMMRYD